MNIFQNLELSSSYHNNCGNIKKNSTISLTRSIMLPYALAKNSVSSHFFSSVLHSIKHAAFAFLQQSLVVWQTTSNSKIQIKGLFKENWLNSILVSVISPLTPMITTYLLSKKAHKSLNILHLGEVLGNTFHPFHNRMLL